MGYYNRDGQKLSLKLETLKHLNCGGCAKVRYNEKIIFKEYYDFTEKEYRLTPEMFDILKAIDNKHLMKIYEIYSKMNILGLLSLKANMTPFIIDAYTAKYYRDDNIDVLAAPKDYMLDNFRELEELFTIFTTNGIKTNDLKRGNTILSSNRIVLIDPDSFSILSASNNALAIKNKKALLMLFKDLLLNCALNKEDYEQSIQSIIKKADSNLTSFEINEDTEITTELSKKLKYVKRPIDYFRK